MFRGSMVAIITPFKDGRIDEQKLKELVEWHIESGTSAIIPCGTTGESATLTHEEHNSVIEIVVEASRKRIPVIAGTGSNNTKEAILLTQHAKEVGADAVLLIAPYYNRPTQNGMFEHFKAIAENVNIPIILYNIASRTGVNMEPSLVEKLSKIKNIVGIKEASGNISQMGEIKNLCGANFDLISGDDALTLPVMSIGGTGVISVVANIIPKDVAKLVESFEKGDLETAKKYHYKMMNLIKAMFIETNPAPVKKAMELMGICSSDVRLPLVGLQDSSIEKLKQAMKEYGV